MELAIISHKLCVSRSYEKCPPIYPTTGLDFGEEVCRTRTLWVWSNMISYATGSSLVGVCTTTKTSLVKNLKQGWKNDTTVNMSTLC